MRVVFDPKAVDCAALVKLFFESHDPTQGMRQGNYIGTQYRSGMYAMNPEQRRVAEDAEASYGRALAQAGRRGAIATEILDTPDFYHAEDCHQQYLARNPNGYCGLGGTGVPCPVGFRAAHRRAD